MDRRWKGCQRNRVLLQVSTNELGYSSRELKQNAATIVSFYSKLRDSGIRS